MQPKRIHLRHYEGKGKGVQRETGTALCPCVPLGAGSAVSGLNLSVKWTPKRTPKELKQVSLGKVNFT